MRDLCSAVRRCKSSVEKECLGRRRHEEEPVDRLILLLVYIILCAGVRYGGNRVTENLCRQLLEVNLCFFCHAEDMKI